MIMWNILTMLTQLENGGGKLLFPFNGVEGRREHTVNPTEQEIY